MRPELPDILRAYARDFGIAGAQYATLCAALREAADALSPPRSSPAPGPAACPVIDDDGYPVLGVAFCRNCED